MTCLVLEQDEDPYVRKTAAMCVAKLHDINAELVEDRGFLDSLKVSDSWSPLCLNINGVKWKGGGILHKYGNKLRTHTHSHELAGASTVQAFLILAISVVLVALPLQIQPNLSWGTTRGEIGQRDL